MTDTIRPPATLGDALPREMARVRDEVMPAYQALEGMPGAMVGPALSMMRTDLDRAARALAEGVRCYEALKGYST